MVEEKKEIEKEEPISKPVIEDKKEKEEGEDEKEAVKLEKESEKKYDDL